MKLTKVFKKVAGSTTGQMIVGGIALGLCALGEQFIRDKKNTLAKSGVELITQAGRKFYNKF